MLKLGQNNPSAIPLINSTSLDNSTLPAITQNRSIPLSFPGFQVDLEWEEPGKITGYNGSYMTNTSAGPAQFVAWISQVNTTYTPLFNINGTCGSTLQPGDLVFNQTVLGNGSTPIVNGTVYVELSCVPRTLLINFMVQCRFIAVTDANITVTPFNLTMLNPHIVAGPAIYQSG